MKDTTAATGTPAAIDTTGVVTPRGAPGPDTNSADTIKAVAAAVARVPGVARLGGGGVAGIATYLPGEQVTGVRVRDAGTEREAVEVAVVADYGPVLPVVAEAVRAAVTGVLPGRPVDVTVNDLVVPGPVS